MAAGMQWIPRACRSSRVRSALRACVRQLREWDRADDVSYLLLLGVREITVQDDFGVTGLTGNVDVPGANRGSRDDVRKVREQPFGDPSTAHVDPPVAHFRPQNRQLATSQRTYDPRE